MFHKNKCRFLALILTLAMTLSFTTAFAAEAVAPADSVYRNGNIYTMNDKAKTATAMAIVGDKLVYVGDEAGVAAYIGDKTVVTDLAGQTVLPGLVEGHMHIGNLGSSLLMIDAFWKPKDVIIAAVAEAAKTAKPGEWIQGRGWMNTVWEDDSFPTKEDLDAVAPNNPVSLQRADAHMFWFNSKALELGKITKDTPNPQGGEIMKNEKGEVTGCLTDTAAAIVRNVIPPMSLENQKKAILLAQDQLFSYGFTSAMDAGATVGQLENYKTLYTDGSLKLRLYPLVMLGGTTGAEAEYVKNNKPTEMLYNNHMAVKAVKIIGDGSLGSRSSAMLEDYSDRADWTGSYRFTDKECYDVMKLAYDAGYQIGYHAIGDGANDQAINTYEKIMKENPREDPRLRIEHFQIVTPADIDRAIKLGILPAMQFTHATSDMLMAEDRVGAERMKGAYAWRTVIDKGSIIVGGSDAPVELVNPYHGLYAGVTRMAKDGSPDGGWYPNQKVTREEALKSFTLWAAYGQFEEKLKGSLEVGKLADFVVIDRDYMTCPEVDIKDIQALTTVSGGEVVYTKDTTTPTIMWQGKPLTFNSKIVVQPGTIYVPLTDLMTGIKATQVTKDGSAAITLKDKTVSVPVRTTDGTDYVGVRAALSGLGVNVTWYPLSRTISTACNYTPAPATDEYSFNLGNFDGTIGAFCDVIMTEAKDLAFSDPFDPADTAKLTALVSKKCANYGVKYYIDTDLLLTKLFDDVDMEGQWVYILYKDDKVLDSYLALKAEEATLKKAGTYTEAKQTDLATRYGKLMGYSDEVIKDMVKGA
ncbi:MAG: amidohydrolase [Oscillospiraceae bacterium]